MKRGMRKYFSFSFATCDDGIEVHYEDIPLPLYCRDQGSNLLGESVTYVVLFSSLDSTFHNDAIQLSVSRMVDYVPNV
jgi:hypothetical protein